MFILGAREPVLDSHPQKARCEPTPAGVVPRALGCSIQDRVSSASSLTQPWETNRNLGFCLLWELPTLPPGECHSQQTLESSEILSAGEEPLWLALRSSDCNTRLPCARIHSSHSLGWGQQRVWATGESKSTTATFFSFLDLPRKCGKNPMFVNLCCFSVFNSKSSPGMV